MSAFRAIARASSRLFFLVFVVAQLGACASGQGLIKSAPAWALELRSTRSVCTEAAAEAKSLALAQGISTNRLQWLYGKKPFSDVGHVSLVIDGWIVVDNGGLGRDVWGAPICPGQVCTLAEARRGLQDSFLESADLVVRDTFGQDEWAFRVASAP